LKGALGLLAQAEGELREVILMHVERLEGEGKGGIEEPKRLVQLVDLEA